MKIAFYEVRDADKAYLDNVLSPHHVLVSQEPLREENVIADADIISVFIYSRVTEQLLKKMPHLRAIVTRSAGIDHIDLEICAHRNIRVLNVPAYGPHTVAEHALALLLALTRQIPYAFSKVKQGHFSLEGLNPFELSGKVVGVLGTGKIGLEFIRRVRSFGTEILAYDIAQNAEAARELDFSYVSLDELVAHADILSLHLPLTPETTHLINASVFTKMKRGVILVNTARGGIIELKALLRALEEGIVAGAALDVFEREDVFQRRESVSVTSEEQEYAELLQRLLQYRNVIITPHMAFYSKESTQRIYAQTLEHLRELCTPSEQSF